MRTVSYPDHPGSRFVFDTQVRAVSAMEWDTDLSVEGTYSGPVDIVSVRDYRIRWTTDGRNLFEEGRATLVTSSGQAVRSEWSSAIRPRSADFSGFPKAGEVVSVSYSPFQIDGNRMSYEWEGKVESSQER